MKQKTSRRRFFRPPPRRAIPTRAGMFVLASPMVLGVAAVSATNNLLFILLAAAMVTVVVSGVLSERNMRGVEVRIRPIGPAYAGEPAKLDVIFSRPAGTNLPSYGLTVRESPQGIWPPWRPKHLKSPEILDAQIAVLDGRQGHVVGHRRFARRGAARLGACELVTTYPFALLNKARDLSVELEVWVRPRRVPCPPELENPGRFELEGEQRGMRGLGLEVYGLRERQTWDPGHRVHALRSLTLGKEVVLELAGAEKPTAWLGVGHGRGVDLAAWERALEVAQAVILAWDERGFAPGLTVGRLRCPPGTTSVDALLDALARVEFAPDAPLAGGPSVWLSPTGALAPSFATRVIAVSGEGRIEAAA